MRIWLLAFGILFSSVGVVFAQTVHWTENFSSVTPPNLPAGWSRVTSATGANSGFNTGTATALSSQDFTVPGGTGNLVGVNDDKCGHGANCSHTADTLFTQNIFVPTGQSVVYLTFDYYYFGGSFQGAQESARLLVSDDNGITWNATTISAIAIEGWNSYARNVSSYAGDSIRVAFAYDDDGGWLFGLMLDNLRLITPAIADLAALSVSVNEFYLPGALSLPVIVQNFGASTVTNYTASYSVNGGAAQSQAVTANMAYTGLDTFNLNIPSTVSGLNEVVMWLSSPNGQADVNNSNDTLRFSFVQMPISPTKHVLVEQFTGAWCQFCPDGSVRLRQLLAAQPNVIGVAWHNQDAMDIPIEATLTSAYISGLPFGLVDRALHNGSLEVERHVWHTAAISRLAQATPAEVGLSYTRTGYQLQVRVAASFHADMQNESRFNVYVIEDSVVGSGSGFDQENAYNTVQGHPYYQAGDPIINYPHRHVVRAALGGAWGQQNSVVGLPVNAEIRSHTFNYTIPPTFDTTSMSVVGLLQRFDADMNARVIYNSRELDIDAPQGSSGMDTVGAVSLAEGFNNLQSFSIYPNPSVSTAFVKVKLQSADNLSIMVRDVTGRVVANVPAQNVGAGSNTVEMETANLAPGVYTVEVRGRKGFAAQKLVVQ